MKISDDKVAVLKDLLAEAPGAQTQKALADGDVVAIANILSGLGKEDVSSVQMQAILAACNLDKDGRTELAVNLLGDVVVREAPRIINWVVKLYHKIVGSK